MKEPSEKKAPSLINPLFRAALLCPVSVNADGDKDIFSGQSLDLPPPSIRAEWQDLWRGDTDWRSP